MREEDLKEEDLREDAVQSDRSNQRNTSVARIAGNASRFEREWGRGGYKQLLD